MLIVFDLDGTLIDSSLDLAIAMNATRAHLGMSLLDPKMIYSYVGNGAAALVRRAIGPDRTEELMTEALRFFLEFYHAHALEHTHLYPGIRETVQELFARDYKLTILTNKPTAITLEIVRALAIEKYFVRIYGGDSFARKKPDPIGVLTLIMETGANRQQAVVVGDSAVDVQTARIVGVHSCGVVWGFQPEAFGTDPPDVVIKTPEELIGYIAKLEARARDVTTQQEDSREFEKRRRVGEKCTRR